jgi:hypothetical protein
MSVHHPATARALALLIEFDPGRGRIESVGTIDFAQA